MWSNKVIFFVGVVGRVEFEVMEDDWEDGVFGRGRLFFWVVLVVLIIWVGVGVGVLDIFDVLRE